MTEAQDSIRARLEEIIADMRERDKYGHTVMAQWAEILEIVAKGVTTLEQLVATERTARDQAVCDLAALQSAYNFINDDVVRLQSRLSAAEAALTEARQALDSAGAGLSYGIAHCKLGQIDCALKCMEVMVPEVERARAALASTPETP